LIVAGIDSLIKGAVGSFAKDKAASFMTPSQMELARFAMNPQMYLADKGITAVAELLGYGNQYQELKAGAEGQKAYGKEVARNAIGDMLPTAIGDFVRATPRVSEADSQPAGIYTAWDPETQTFTQQGSPRPVSTGTSATFDDFLRDLNAGDTQSVGPLEEYDQTRLDDEYDFQTSLSDFQPGLNGIVNDVGEMTIVDQKGSGGGGNLSYADMIDMQNQTLNSTPDYGGGKLEEYFQNQYKRGGQICGCRH
jgi:hypothetical protein